MIYYDYNLSWEDFTTRQTMCSQHMNVSLQIWLQQNQSFGTHQQPPQDTILSLRVVNPRTHLTTLTTYFSKDLIELELVETLRKLREGRVALLTAHVTNDVLSLDYHN